MAAKPKVLDSWAVIAYFEDQPGGDQVEAMLIEARAAGDELLMSVVNVGELWYSLARGYSAAVADEKVAELANLGVQVVDADWQITKQAAEFKTRGNIAYADCFAAALAKVRAAELVTGDREFEQVANEINVVWLS